MNHSRIGLGLLVCALALRLIVAPGFMPVASADGITISICPGMGTNEMAGMHHQGTQRHQGKQAPMTPQQSECAFSGIAALALDELPPIIALLPIAPAAVRFITPAARFPHIGAPAPPPPSTGPPSLI